jgi:CubicO group peptidase (beta-lactamase class C family)
MIELERDIEAIAAESRFSGAVRIDRGGELVLERAYGLARRDSERLNTPETQFATASGLKGMTALAVMCLVEDGVLSLDTTARSVLGDDLPLIADDVTVEHLLGHRSGIGDYLDEDDGEYETTDYVMSVPVHTLLGPEDYVPIIDGHPTKFAAGSNFAYCNGGFVVLALIAERAGGVPYHDLVQQRVCEPAGLEGTAFLRSDELPERAAHGHLFAEGPRTNVLHLPVRGTGDGGIYTTVGDMRAFWTALFDGKIVSQERVAAMVAPSSDVHERWQYGLGLWIVAGTSTAALEGHDAGVSFRSLHDPETDTTCTVVSNWTDGAWPLAKVLTERLFRPAVRE